ncbi:MAG: polymerase sigma-70 factor, subfamily [Acidobacteriota bacterium]|jgi:RNA polymerase sigma-70 factor (ECF subfamily)|nr:polymerase sigma-70 factor, subfamily [Acidobacteriota bacterium]
MDRFSFDDLYVRRLKEHDRETGEHFVRYFSPLLVAKLRGRLPVQDIEDVRQDVLFRVLKRLDNLREGCKLPQFVLGTCNNVMLEQYRKVRTEPLEEWLLLLVGDWDIEKDFLGKEAAAAVRQALSEMRTPREAEILRAIYLDDEDREEVCRRYDVSPDNLRVLLHRAKKKFTAAFRRQNEP